MTNRHQCLILHRAFSARLFLLLSFEEKKQQSAFLQLDMESSLAIKAQCNDPFCLGACNQQLRSIWRPSQQDESSSEAPS